jgi:hypothetical protein
MSILFQIVTSKIGDCVDPNMNFLFDLSSLMTFQAINDVISGSERVELLY